MNTKTVHKTKIEKYNGTLKQIAEDLGNLRYDALSSFLKLLSLKLKKDSISDKKRKRVFLSLALLKAGVNLHRSSANIEAAWKICKPHMQKGKR